MPRHFVSPKKNYFIPSHSYSKKCYPALNYVSKEPIILRPGKIKEMFLCDQMNVQNALHAIPDIKDDMIFG